MSARNLLDPPLREGPDRTAPRRWPRLWRPVAGFVVVVLLAAMIWAVATRSTAPRVPATEALPEPSAPEQPTGAVAPVEVPVTVAALATDEPCTRQITGTELPQPVPFRAEDLERMVPTQDELGSTLTGFSSDMMRHGFQGNSELSWAGELPGAEAMPATACDDLVRYGRMTGFTRAFETYDETGRRVSVSVHLFWAEEDATAWAQAFVEGLRSTVGQPDGATRLTTRPVPELGPDALLVDHEGPQGKRTWAMIRRGTVVGWVVDLHPGDAATIDVLGVAGELADRIDEITATATRRPHDQLDLAQLMSVPLPLSAYGDRYEGLDWMPLWGGCADLEEWAYVVGDDGAAAAREHGRVGVCTSMYSPDPDAELSHDVTLLWSRIEVFPDEDSASAYLWDARRGNAAEETFDVTGVADVDEAVGSRRTLDQAEDGSRWHTRVAVRTGVHLLTVAVNDRTDHDARAELTALAGQLTDRLTAFLELPQPDGETS